MNRTMPIFLLLLAGCPKASDCPGYADCSTLEADTDTDTDTDADTDISYTAEYIAAANAVSGRCGNCHGQSGPGGFLLPEGAALTDLAELRTALEGQVDGSGVQLVVPGDSAASSLYFNADHGGVQTDEQTAIQTWIDSGAAYTL